MGFFAKLAKWKLRWAVVTGLFTVVVLPLLRLVFGKSKQSSSKVKTDGQVIDVKAEEIK
ncbi:MAG: hypothetical protein QG626_197 [Patescibacteria group bacterium]|jgi:hypothetical protein|nr:hypothetical protein [Patescibacteria group bacterium]